MLARYTVIFTITDQHKNIPGYDKNMATEHDQDTVAWVAEEEARLSHLASHMSTPHLQLATEGVNALWDAVTYEVPQLVDPAKRMLGRVAARGDFLQADPISYTHSSIALGFVGVFRDWASNEVLSDASLHDAHMHMADLLPKLCEETDGKYFWPLLCATYTTFVSRAEDPNCVIVPAGFYENHDSFIVANGRPVRSSIEARYRHRPSGDVRTVYAGTFCEQVLKASRPELLENMDEPSRMDFAARYIAMLLVNEVKGTLRANDQELLDNSGQRLISKLTEIADTFEG